MRVLWSFERVVKWRLRQKTQYHRKYIWLYVREIDRGNVILVMKTDGEILEETKRLHIGFIDLKNTYDKVLQHIVIKSRFKLYIGITIFWIVNRIFLRMLRYVANKNMASLSKYTGEMEKLEIDISHTNFEITQDSSHESNDKKSSISRLMFHSQQSENILNIKDRWRIS